MAKNKTDLKALKEANGDTKEILEKEENAFLCCTCDLVNTYLNMLTKARNRITMAYISADIVKMFLKGKNRHEQLNEKISNALKENNINYAEKLLDSMAENIENKSLAFYSDMICKAHDDFLIEITQEQTSESVLFQVKNSAEIEKDIKAYSGVDLEKKKAELLEKQKFYFKNII